MPLLYDRKETPDEIMIVFKSQYRIAYIVIVLTFLISSGFKWDPKWQLLITGLFLILIFFWIFSRWKINSEIREAAKKGEVKVSGNQYSLKNPLTVKIKK